jgi:hypothetical protein
MDPRSKTGDAPATRRMSVEPAVSTSASTVADDEIVATACPFPCSVVMPPAHTLKSYSELDLYLKQSDLIHKAFKSRFGTKKCTTTTDDVGTDSQLSDFLPTINKRDKRDDFIAALIGELLDPYPNNVRLAVLLSSLVTAHASKLKVADPLRPELELEGDCILLELWFRELSSEFVRLHPDDPVNSPSQDLLKQILHSHIEDWKSAIDSLAKPTTENDDHMPKEYQKNVASAFGSTYHDHFNARDAYVNKLLGHVTTWQNESDDYNAPYTSLINASMMGKSRLVKQISDVIPTIYICVRKNSPGMTDSDDGYPKRSPDAVHDYLKGWPKYKHDEMTLERYAILVEHYYVGIFIGILHAIREWTDPCDPITGKWRQFYDPNSNYDLHLLRQRLGYHLAEPGQPRQAKFRVEVEPDEDGERFWTFAAKAARGLPYFKDNELGDRMKTEFLEAWHIVKPYLSVGGSEADRPRTMLLIVWDEARSLVEEQVQYLNRFVGTAESSLSVPEDVSVFIMLRRALRSLARVSPERFEIFNIFTDTTSLSRIGNFQACRDFQACRNWSSGRTVIMDHAPPNSKMFDPIVVLPGIDSAAYNLKVTVKTKEVQQPGRLLKFSRPGWSLWAGSGSGNAQLAHKKLFNQARSELSPLFDPRTKMKNNRLKIYDDDKLRFLACICCRLAIQTGSYVTSKLVSSHMMALLRVGENHENHDQLESSYLSEPVLAEAAAEATGRYGWVLPLKILVSEMRAGVVWKGFRGEFVTRALVMIAMEDAQRSRLKERLIQDAEDERHQWRAGRHQSYRRSYWDWSQVVTVSSFLDALLQNPVNKRSDSPQSPKRVRQQNYSSEKFDDAGDDDDAHIIETPDKYPEPRGTDDHVLPNLLDDMPKEFKKLEPASIETILDGRVFFNHWVVLEYPQIRPSTIVKAWNRCAALVAKDGVRGVDFLIPVLLNEESIPEADRKQFEELQLFGRPWTIDNERFAERFVSYILRPKADWIRFPGSAEPISRIVSQ